MALKSYMLETPLFFSHGVEIENHLVDINTGDVLVGNDLLTVWEQMFNGAADYLKKLKKSKNTPKAIASKIVKIEVAEEIKREKRLKFVFVHYRLGKKTIRINAFGPDPNISQITWLLELVTPPCEFLEELAFWIDSLFAAALHGLSKAKIKSALLPIGLNPMEKRVRSGLTCGEHHHIGIPSFFRAPVFNMIRNFIPHLIALSSTSPFLDQKPTSKILIKDKDGKKQIISRGTHSYRLAYNTGQMGPNIPQYLPVINETMTRNEFAESVKKTPPDDRMIDVFPYTDYSTIELRFFDAQPWSENRLAIILLIQAIAQKAKNIVSEKQLIPTVSGKSLYENRRKAVQFGLLAQFTRDESLSGDFSWFYNHDIEKGVKASKLFQSVLGMLIFLEDELLEFESKFVDYLLLPILGSKKYTPPFTVCDYLLALYTEQNNQIETLLKKLYYSEKMEYPPKVDGDFSSFLVENPPEILEMAVPEAQDLSQALRKDLATRQIHKEKSKPKKRRKKIPPKKEVVVEKRVRKKVPKKAPVKTPVKKKKVPPKKIEPKVEPKIPAAVKPAVVEKVVPKELPEAKIISAFDQHEDLEIYSPTIDFEPKYEKINSKIANAMRTRRKEIEAKRAVFFQEHLKEEERDFKPFPKRKIEFPALISGSILFGFISFTFSDIKKVMYQFRNNPITLRFLDKETNNEISEIRTFIDIASIEKRNVVRIPCSIDIGELYGKISLRVEAVTATNQRLLPENVTFTFERKDEISITTKEFYITGNYGSVECIYKAVNEGKKADGGELKLLLAAQSLSAPIVLFDTKFNLKPKESFEFAKSINLSIDYQHSSFYLITRITTGLFKKNRVFKSIHVPVLREIAVDWSFAAHPGSKNDLQQGVQENTRYEIDFLFHFLKSIPPAIITVYIHTFPMGQTKKLTSLRLTRREIDKGDEFNASRIRFKTPKKCGYLIFDAEVRTEKGVLVPPHLISEPIGVYGVKDSFEKRRDLEL